MTTYLLRRLLWVLPSLFVVFTLTFILVHATPGSPWDESDQPLPAAVKENLARQYHLDDPLPKQYVDYLANVLRGDFGPSYRSVERSVSEIIGATLPVSAQIGLASILFAIVVGVPLGALAAVKHNTWIDYVSSLITVTGIATPPFVREHSDAAVRARVAADRLLLAPAGVASHRGLGGDLRLARDH